MRRASSSERMSLGPLRVRNEDNGRSRSMAPGKRTSTSGGRSLSGNRLSFTGRPSITGSRKRPSVSIPTFGLPKQKNRLSSATPRKSGMGVKTVNGAPKDPRPISDRGYSMKCMKRVLEFLMTNRYPYNITLKVLQSPTSKDFYKIFEFIMGYIIPKYKVSQKPEEAIPRLLRQLGYPYLISKTSMFAIGSPHTWPSILAALVFLTDLIIVNMTQQEGSIDSVLFPADDFDTKPESQIVYQYVERGYHSYMDGNDEFDAEDNDLRHALREKFLGSGGIDGLLETNRNLEEQVTQLEQDTDQLGSVKEKLLVAQHDEERFRGYLKQLETHKKEQELLLAQTEEQCASLEADMQAEEMKLEQMKEIESKQEYSQADVEQIHQKGRELKRQCDDLDREVQTLNQDIWKLEIAMSKDSEECETKRQSYVKAAKSLKLVPITAENAGGIDYEIKKPPLADVNDFQNKIKPALTMIKSQCKESLQKKETEKIKVAEQLESLRERLSDLQNEATLLDSKHKRADDEVESKRQLFQGELERLHGEADRLQNELVQLTSLGRAPCADTEVEMKKIQAWSTQEKEKSEKKLKDYSNFFTRALQMFMDHMEFMQNQILSASERSKIELEKVKEECQSKGLDIDEVIQSV
ncbi:kinetochore protein NDC80 homolog [Mya arenaria]|uniref:kinetochore protein NDC80 homolog n=1 Tax=Mya arenaria TaxID=6604 RepID=UPI0022E6A346|nr:kinetochore protein NDC80 homolog [Mya arenaria]